MIEVTQADREAAIKIFAMIFGNGHSATYALARSDRHFLFDELARHRIAAENAARGDQVARLIAHMKTIEPDEETAGCPATWADFIQILEGIAEAGEPFNG